MSNLPSLPDNATDEERIIHYLKDETGQVELAPKLEELYHMINFCDDQLRRFMSTKNVAALLRKKFDIGISKAYQIIAQTQVVFGTTKKVHRDYYRQMLADALVEDLNKARTEGDHKAASAYYDRLCKIQGLDRPEDNSVPPPAPPAVICFLYDPSIIGVKVSDKLEQRANEYLNIKTEDTSAEEVYGDD